MVILSPHRNGQTNTLCTMCSKRLKAKTLHARPEMIPKPEAWRNLRRTLQQKPPCKPCRVWHTRANLTGRGQEATAHTCGAEAPTGAMSLGGRNQAERPVLEARCEARSPTRTVDSSRTTAGQKLLSCGLACEQTETAQKEPSRPPLF